MQKLKTRPSEVISSLVRNRELLIALTKREIIGKYKGSLLGVLWSFLTPVFMLLVYTFVFSVVFKARWSGGSDSKSEFALILFAGLLVFNLFSECISRAPNLVLLNSNYVKKIVFPLEILPWVILGAATFHLMVSLLVWLIFYVILFGTPHATVLLFPLVLLPLILFSAGLSWWLSSLGVYWRDVGQFIGVIITALMFLSPIFYPVTSLPKAFQTVVYLNPLSIVIEQTREILFWGRIPNIIQWVAFLLGSSIIAWLGFIWFQKTRKGFADVL